jgi:hypothetical protein
MAKAKGGRQTAKGKGQKAIREWLTANGRRREELRKGQERKGERRTEKDKGKRRFKVQGSGLKEKKSK